MDLAEAIKTRRSIRKYQDREVPTSTLLEAIESACWAPNGGNFQPWKFFVIVNRETIGRIADAVQAKVDLMAEWPEAAEFGDTFARYRRNAAFFRSAPAVIAVAMAGYQSAADKVLRARGEDDAEARTMIANRQTVNSRVQTIAGAIAYLLLELHARGLGACWMAGPMLAKREIERRLGVPGDMDIFALVPVGFPAESPPPGARKPLKDVVTVIA